MSPDARPDLDAHDATEARVAAPLAEGIVAREVVRIGCRLAALMASSFAGFYWLVGPEAFVLPNLAAAVVLLTIGGLRRVATDVLLYATVVCALVLLGVQLSMVGEIDNGIAVWFVVPNVAAMLLGERRLAIFAGATTTVELGLVTTAADLGWLVPRVVLARPDVVMLASLLGVLVLCGGFAGVSHRHRNRLTREIGARSQDLAFALERTDEARRAAVAAAEAKDRFFANLTHEIRTPLNGIASTAELLGHAGLDAVQKELVDILDTSTANLVQLVNAMLDHARLRAGRVPVEPAPVEVRTAAADLLGLFQAEAAAKGLDLSVRVAETMPAWIEVDAVKVRQVAGNLVANAVKFTTNGSVTVDFDLRSPDAGDAQAWLLISVADTGSGIPADQVDAIFEPFVQGDASISRTHGGTGLGLAIASQLAELLGGTLTVSSHTGEGSEFTLAVPVRAVPAAAVPAAPAAPPEPARPPAAMRVLLAEDNEINQAVASRMLARLDADVVVAENGYRAVELAADGGFAVVLMDLQMPGMDGIAAAREIRRAERAGGRPGVPIVAMSGNDPADYGDACADAGMNGFLMKPVRLDDLRALLARIAAAEAPAG